MRVAGHILRRVLLLIPILFVVTFVSFYLINLLPGDPALVILGPGATPAAIAHERAVLGLNQGIIPRYGHYLDGLVHGSLGQSSVTQEPVATEMAQRLPVTLEVLVLSQIVALALSIPLAVAAARKPNSVFDRLSSAGSIALLSAPGFMLGVLLAYVFAVKAHVLPATGFTPLGTSLGDNLRTMVLPALTLGLGSVAVYLRVLRTDMISTLQQDYITMARAKGMSPRWVLMRHAFRPSTFAFITVAGLNIGALIGGALVVEQVFALPGIGTLAITAIEERDYSTVQGVILVAGGGFVLINFLVDALYQVIDPRARVARAS